MCQKDVAHLLDLGIKELAPVHFTKQCLWKKKKRKEKKIVIVILSRNQRVGSGSLYEAVPVGGEGR